MRGEAVRLFGCDKRTCANSSISDGSFSSSWFCCSTSMLIPVMCVKCMMCVMCVVCMVCVMCVMCEACDVCDV